MANDLIASLRKELSIQKAQSNEARAQQELLTSTQSTLTTAESQVTELKASLASAQNENKALQAKLAASRFAATNAETNPAYGKTPGSAAKGRAQASRLANGVNADAGSAAQVAQLKEDLYSDLTGLILRGVDRQEETDTYDCIQTGRNGSEWPFLLVTKDMLRTKSPLLSLADSSRQPSTSSSLSPPTPPPLTTRWRFSTCRGWTRTETRLCWRFYRIIYGKRLRSRTRMLRSFIVGLWIL